MLYLRHAMITASSLALTIVLSHAGESSGTQIRTYSRGPSTIRSTPFTWDGSCTMSGDTGNCEKCGDGADVLYRCKKDGKIWKVCNNCMKWGLQKKGGCFMCGHSDVPTYNTSVTIKIPGENTIRRQCWVCKDCVAKLEDAPKD